MRRRGCSRCLRGGHAFHGFPGIGPAIRTVKIAPVCERRAGTLKNHE